MLVILTGPTGSGKTALALLAARRRDWRILETLTTRPRRTLDTKRHVDQATMDAALASGDHRTFSYDGFQYATPLTPVHEAANTVDFVALVDWVHPHPEDLTEIGPYAIGIVLLPSVRSLAARLETAGRPDRAERAISERAEIAARIDIYQPPWYVLESDEALSAIEEKVVAMVRASN
jgi:guanylate kinase